MPAPIFGPQTNKPTLTPTPAAPARPAAPPVAELPSTTQPAVVATEPIASQPEPVATVVVSPPKAAELHHESHAGECSCEDFVSHISHVMETLHLLGVVSEDSRRSEDVFTFRGSIRRTDRLLAERIAASKN